MGLLEQATDLGLHPGFVGAARLAFHTALRVLAVAKGFQVSEEGGGFGVVDPCMESNGDSN